MQAEDYRRTLQELGESGVRYCLLRDRIQPGLELRDLDILIHPNDMANALPCLKALGFVVRRPLSKSLHKMTMLAVDGSSSLHLDIHIQPVQEGLVFMDVDKLMSRLTDEDGYWIPCSEHQLVLLIVHNILGKGHIQPKHRAAVARLSDSGLDSDVLEDSLSDFGLSRFVDEVARNPSQYFEPGPVPSRLREQMRRRLLWKNRAHWVRLLRIRWMHWRYYHGLRRKGTLITLIGPDGSGKSSLATALAARIKNTFGSEVPIVYLGPWGEFQLSVARKIRYNPWARGTRSWKHLWAELRGKNLVSAPFVVLRYAKYHFRSYLGLLTLYAELMWRYTKIYRHLRAGRHVIADRYIYDLWVGGMHFVTDERKHAIRLLSWLFPRPDQCIYLSNSPEVLFERKGELSVETGKQILEVYEEIAESVGGHRMKTDRLPEALADQIVRENYRDMLAKMQI